MKSVDFSIPVHDLAQQDPDFIDIMAEAGFNKIKIPGMLDTIGRFVNINRGCVAMNLDKQTVIETFKAHGYEVVNYD